MTTSFTVRDYMSARRLSFSPTMDVLEAIDLLVEQNISGAPVIDDRGRLLGFFFRKRLYVFGEPSWLS